MKEKQEFSGQREGWDIVQRPACAKVQGPKKARCRSSGKCKRLSLAVFCSQPREAVLTSAPAADPQPARLQPPHLSSPGSLHSFIPCWHLVRDRLLLAAGPNGTASLRLPQDPCSSFSLDVTRLDGPAVLRGEARRGGLGCARGRRQTIAVWLAGLSQAAALPGSLPCRGQPEPSPGDD